MSPRETLLRSGRSPVISLTRGGARRGGLEFRPAFGVHVVAAAAAVVGTVIVFAMDLVWLTPAPGALFIIAGIAGASAGRFLLPTVRVPGAESFAPVVFNMVLVLWGLFLSVLGQA